MKVGIGKRDKHLADGVLLLPDNKHVAIEVELTMKSKSRLKEIMLGYALHEHIKEVWYFCAPGIVEKVRKVAGDREYIKVFSLHG